MTKVVQKYKVLDSVTGISATETDSTVYDVRGCEDVVFDFLCTLNTGFSTGTVFFKGKILGCDTRDGTFREILTTAELVVDTPQQIPSAANAPGTVLPRFIKVKWEETGSMTSFTATCTMRYNRPKRGKGVSHGYMGG